MSKHRILCNAETLEEAEALRKKLLGLRPRPWTYVVYGPNIKGYDICIANEHGSYPSDKFFAWVEEEVLSIEIEVEENGEETSEPEVKPEEMN